jgi:2'-5' RNA ligase
MRLVTVVTPRDRVRERLAALRAKLARRRTRSIQSATFAS